MHPTIDLDFIEIPVYTALVTLGALVGMLTTWTCLQIRFRRAATARLFWDGALVALIAGWVGARAYHAATHWDYYSARPDEIAQIGLGGLAMRGALLAGVVAVLLYTRWRGIAFARLADAIALGLAVGQAIGWAGALVQGANYGIENDWLIAMDLPDLYGLVAPRFPLQLAEITLFAALFIGLVIFAFSKPRAGALAATYLVVSSAANLALGFQRGDETLWLAGLRLDQWFDAGAIAVALVFWLWIRRGGNGGINQ